MKLALVCTVAATVTAISCGCGPIKSSKNVPAAEKLMAKEATRDELVGIYNAVAQGVKSLNATVNLKPTAGSEYSGVIQEYHEVKAFLLLKRPAEIRMIGQAPVIGKTIFDMTSDGETFRVSIPSKQKFLVGQVAQERQSKKPIENLRPQHLVDVLLWPEIRKEEQVLLEEYNDESGRYYVLNELRGGHEVEIARKIWFDRADLHVSRIEAFGPRGALVSDARYAGWEPTEAPDGSGAKSFPRAIRFERPRDDYRLELEVSKLGLNEEIPAERFHLEQPAGTQLVRVGEEAEEKKP